MAEDEGAINEMQAALAAQLLQLRPRDLLTQTAVMLANQAAIRIGMASPEHADREQAREAIDALAGVIELLAPTAEPDELEALRRDLAQLRMAFVQSGEPAAPPPAADEPPPEDEGPGEERPPIWTPRRRGLTGRIDARGLPRRPMDAPAGFLDAVAPEPVADVSRHLAESQARAHPAYVTHQACYDRHRAPRCA